MVGAREPAGTAPTVTAIGKPRERFALPEVGEVVGRYTVLGKLGEGAMGAVFLASDPELDRRVALKLLVSHGAHDFRLLDEARALARLQHPNVVAVHDVGRWEGQVYIAMEHIAGTSLANWLDKHAGWRERVDAFVQAAHGLAAAHRAGIVHHDVKPSNVMVGDDGRVRLVDFGIARSTTPDLAHGSVAGTPRYMSPEQHRGDVADARTDQFSLCVALYEAVFDSYPFPDEDPVPRVPAANRSVPVATRDAILKGLAYEPANRHATMEAFIEALTPPPRGRRLWIAALAAFAIAGGTGAAFALRDSHDARAGKYDAILAASKLTPVQHEPLPDDPLGVTVHRLSNGLTVFISPNRDRPRIRATMRFHAGSADGPGVSTLAMVMSRRGSDRMGTVNWEKEKPLLDRIAKLYEQRRAAKDTVAIDAEIAALTTEASQYEIVDEHSHLLVDLGAANNNINGSRDQSRFDMDFSSNQLETWAEIEAERWTKSEFRAFRPAVVEALQWNKGAFGFLDNLTELLYPKLHPDHGIGFAAGSVRRVMATEPYTESVKFFRERYVPNNADLFLAGDVDPVTAIPILERAFAKWEPKPLPKRERPKPAVVKAETIDFPTTGNRELSYTYSLPDMLEYDPAFIVFDVLLRRTLSDRNAAGRVGINYAYSIGWTASGSLDDAARQLDQLLAEMRDGKFTDDALNAAKKQIEVKRFLDARDLNARIMRMMALSSFRRIVWREEVERFNKMKTVTRADVIRVAKQIFDAPHLTVRAEPGKVETETLAIPTAPPTKFATGRSAWAKNLLDRETVEIQPKFAVAGTDYETRETPAGLVVTKTDKKSPLFTLTFRYDVANGELPLSCDALAARMGGNEHMQRLRTGGFNVYTLCSDHVVLVTITGLDEDIHLGITTAAGAFQDPTEAEWAEMLRQSKLRLGAYLGRSDWVNQLLEGAAMFGRSYPMLARYDYPFLESASFPTAVAALGKMRASKRAVTYYGPLTLDELAPMLPAMTVVDVPKVRSPNITGKPRVYIVDAKQLTDTANVALLYGVDDAYEKDRIQRLELFDQYWSAVSHPIDNAVRTLQFDLDIRIMYPNSIRDAAHVAMRFRSPAAKVATAIPELLHAVFETPVDEVNVARAKKERAQRLASDWTPRADEPGRVASFIISGEPEDPRRAFQLGFAKRDKSDVEAIIAELRAAPHAIAIWGAVDGLDRAALAKYGEIVDISVQELLQIYEPVAAPAPKTTSPAPVKKRAKPVKRKKRR